MSGNELAALSRAHELFAGRIRSAAVDARLAPYDGLLERAAALNTVAGQGGYQSAVTRSRDDLRAAATADAAVAATVVEAHRDHANVQLTELDCELLVRQDLVVLVGVERAEAVVVAVGDVDLATAEVHGVRWDGGPAGAGWRGQLSTL